MYTNACILEATGSRLLFPFVPGGKTHAENIQIKLLPWKCNYRALWQGWEPPLALRGPSLYCCDCKLLSNIFFHTTHNLLPLLRKTHASHLSHLLLLFFYIRVPVSKFTSQHLQILFCLHSITHFTHSSPNLLNQCKSSVADCLWMSAQNIAKTKFCA